MGGNKPNIVRVSMRNFLREHPLTKGTSCDDGSPWFVRGDNFMYINKHGQVQNIAESNDHYFKTRREARAAVRLAKKSNPDLEIVGGLH